MGFYLKSNKQIWTAAAVAGSALEWPTWTFAHPENLPFLWKIPVVLLMLAVPYVLSFFLISIGNGILIRLLGREDLTRAQKEILREFVTANAEPPETALHSGLIRKVAQKSVWKERALVQEVWGEEVRKLTQGKQAQLTRLQSEAETLRRLQTSPIAALCEKFAQSWQESPLRELEISRIDDPVWGGYTYIDQELFPLFRHPLVQRLNYIKQLSFAYLTFPTATHSRLSHTLGTLRLIEDALNIMFRKNVVYSTGGQTKIPLNSTERREIILRAKAAALLHDLGHAPFGHALDRLIGFLDPQDPKPYPDKYFSRLYIQRWLAPFIQGYATPEVLAAILRADATQLTGWDTLISALIDSPLDVDRMDFLLRDAHMTGLSVGTTPVQALLEKMSPYDADGCIYLTYLDPCRTYIEDLLSTREKMYVECYEHPKKLAAERIFTRLIENLVSKNALKIEEVILLTDDQIVCLLAQWALGSSEDSELLRALMHNVEYRTVLEVDISSPSAAVKHWRTLRDGKGMGKSAYIDTPSYWEQTIAEASGLGQARSWQVLVVVPEYKVRKYTEAETLILQSDGQAYVATPMADAYADIEEILNKFRSPRTKIRVFAHSALSDAERNAVDQAAQELLCRP